MKTRYEVLGKEISSKCLSSSPNQQKQCCPMLTRARLLTTLALTILTLLLLLSQCLQPGLLKQDLLCCNKDVAVPRKAAYIDDDYQYDDALEGAQNIRYKHTKRRFPQCLIIGVRKGGTRALLEFMNLHPSVQAEKREMHFFDDDDTYNFGFEWYRKKMPFSFSDQITVEKTPSYFVGEAVPERVYKMNNSIKLIVILRDPVERAISDYTQIHSTRTEKGKPHSDFHDLVIDLDTGEVNRSYKAIRRSVYHRHMERWLKWFPLEQFLFVNGENLVKNPSEELYKVETFLNIEHKLTEDHFYFNKTRGFYCIHLEHREKCLAKSKGRKHPEVDPNTLQKLRDFFRPHNQNFFKMIGINFDWA